MLYLLIKEKGKNKYYLECPEIYGVETWGSTHQTTLEKKRKYWYVEYWTAGNDYEDDVTESYRVNVVLETTDLQEVLNYVIKATGNDKAAVDSILEQAQEIYREYVAFENWATSRNYLGDFYND